MLINIVVSLSHYLSTFLFCITEFISNVYCVSDTNIGQYLTHLALYVLLLIISDFFHSFGSWFFQT